MTTLNTSERKLVVRIRCEGEIFCVEASLLREEVPALYRGFEQWNKDQYPVVPLKRLLEVQENMLLCVDMPGRGVTFCDLTQEDISSDPFQVFDTARLYHHEVWEYLPESHTTQRLYPLSDTRKELLDLFEDSLYDE